MGEGLKKVAKQCGGLTATSKDGKTVEYDKNGKKKKTKKIKRLETFESFTMKLFETGEPDLNYTDENMDKIVELLEAEGYEAYYKEFDKQGVYLVIRKEGKPFKFWWSDTYSTGKWSDGAVSSTLIDDDGNQYSGSAGDYWDVSKDHVFQDSILIYKFRKNGKIETKKIDNPKVSDLPEMVGLGIGSEFTPKNEIMEFTLDSDENTVIKYVVGSDDISEFIYLLK